MPQTVLLVPAVVNKDIGYRDAWERSQQQIRKMIPLAAELKVVIAIEEVWNHFLLSPIEFARYVDDFKSPWVKAYFDVGNVVLFSFPQDWIRILGPRIVKVHLKDFSFRKGVTKWDMLARRRYRLESTLPGAGRHQYHGQCVSVQRSA